ncbi:MAG: SNF2-related protein [Bacillota bacterium]
MARSKQYGKTWWGNAWVEAMERIDYNTNRLPRGRSYANAGRVSEIQIDPKGRVLARVKGTRPTPYKIEIKLKGFTPGERKAIETIIAKDPALAAELSMGRLPETILRLLEEKNISLLPAAWDDITTTCSCPDWANPCKHLAAIYYIIANEIDKDPLILFKLRNLDTGEMMRAAGFGSPQSGTESAPTEGITAGIPGFISYREAKIAVQDYATAEPGNHAGKADRQGRWEQGAASVDLSALAGNRESESIFALLSDFPLFYPGGNFKELLLKAYKNISCAMEKLELRENDLSFKDVAFTLLYPSAGQMRKSLLKKHPVQRYDSQFFFFTAPAASASGEEKLPPAFVHSPAGEERTLNMPLTAGEKLILRRKKGVQLPLGAVVDLFLSLPFGLPANHTSPWADFLNAVTAVTRALAGSSSFVPVLRGLEGETSDKGQGSFYVVYRPLDRSGKLQAVMDYLVSIMPLGFLFCQGEKGVLEGTAAVDEFLTLVLTYIVGCFAGIKPSTGDKVARSFFCGEPYRAEKFEEQQTAKAISDWLGWLNLRPAAIAPVIDIGMPKPGMDKFTLRVKVEDKRDPLAPVLRLKEVFAADREELFSLPIAFVRQEVARQLTVAGEHVPTLKKLLSYKGEKLANLAPPTLAEFLTRGQQICSLLGIRVMIPKALQQIAVPRVALAAKTTGGKEKGISYFNLDEMLEFSWQVSLGGITLSGEEFRKLAESAAGVVKFRDQYLLLQPEEVSGILKKLHEPVPQLSAMETLQAAVTGEAAGAIFNPDRVLRQLVDDLGTTREISLPSGLIADLRPYQQRGFTWLYHNTVRGLGSCLADDMGLGKTVQVIALIVKLKEEGWLEKPALVVCPTALISNWVKECNKFAPSLQVVVYHGNSRGLTTKGVDLIVTSYGILRRDVAKFKRNKWGLVVIDEAQNIKNPDSNQTRAVKSLAAKSYIAMSGTPVENRLVELWSIFDFINRGYLGRWQDFASRFALPIEKYRDGDKINKLQKATAPFLLRRLKSDRTIIKDLPPKIVKEEHCYLSKEQAALYQQVVENMMREIEESEGIARKGLVFKLMTALKQICNHPVQYTKKGKAEKEHSGKAIKALALLEQAVAAGEKALLFTQYREMGELLVGLIRDELQVEALFFHGGVSRQKRDEMVEKFQGEDGFPIMIVSLKAGGTGLNLTAATSVIHYDLWWNPAVEDQATDRTFRIGQNRTVMVHRLLSLGTFEEKINEMMSAKRELAELTVAVGESSLSELSNQELRELFKLQNSGHDMALPVNQPFYTTFKPWYCWFPETL